ncbi:MAG TPA: DUF2845 domain-containing protein [Dyella sp.]|uniref:DUF2845 domain-containing protein n=1 Tax=Dyella sp. TaxID=1869338 RepID=UPI002D779AF8|nr:DUF2845 domain-containing protein [Dyella sp.]HET6553471.1 DUF2845 domain-containing protein [Dyella sp.]
MRRWMGGIGLLVALAANAGSGTLRVGAQVLVVGDSAARVVELLGKPSYKSRGKSTATHQAHKTGRKSSAHHGAAEVAGEQWQYRDGNHTVTVVVVDGRVSAIRDGGR